MAATIAITQLHSGVCPFKSDRTYSGVRLSYRLKNRKFTLNKSIPTNYSELKNRREKDITF